MLLKLENPKPFIDSVALLSEIVLEVKAKVSKEGFEITAIDPANVALAALKIPAAAFSSFELEKDQELGLNLEDLKQILKRATNNLTLERHDNILRIKLNENRAFDLALIDIEATQKQLPKLNFKAKVEVKSSDFAEAIADAAIVADSCSLKVSNESFTIEARGSLNSARTELNEAKIEAQEAVKAKYSLDYLLKFVKAAKLSPKVTVWLSNDYPARFDFKNESLELSFLLAPRIEE